MLRRHTVSAGQVDEILSFTSNFVADIKSKANKTIIWQYWQNDTHDTAPITWIVKPSLYLFGLSWAIETSHLDLHSTAMKTDLLDAFPMLLSAVQTWSPSSLFPRTVKKLFMIVPSFVQVMFGLGLPTALQVRFTDSLWFTVIFSEM